MLETASDPIVLLLLTLVFFDARFGSEFKTSGHLGFLSLAWVANFVLIPILAWSISSLFLEISPPFASHWFASLFPLSMHRLVFGLYPYVQRRASH